MSLKCSIAAAQKDGNHAGSTCREINAVQVVDGEVDIAISVVVPYGHALRHRGGGILHLALERTIAVAEKDTYRAVAAIGHGKVGVAVAVHVSNYHRTRSRACGEGLLSLKGAVAVA